MSVHASAVMPWRGACLAFLRPGPLRVGPLRFTPFGLCAAAGLVAAMTLVRRCARRVGLDPEAAWDAGLFAIFSCFVASRLLLILQSPRAFFHYPLALLGLPSLTLGGMALAAAATVAYLRRKHLSPVQVLDSFAAPAAMLAAFLELGHWLDGSETGMPTELPWGVTVPEAAPGLRVHPVALYGVLMALALAAGLWFFLTLPAPRARLSRVLPGGSLPGSVAALGMVSGGLAAFMLDMLSVPPLSTATPGLEPGQWVALTAMLAGTLLWLFAPGPVSVKIATQTSSPTEPLHREVH